MKPSQAPAVLVLASPKGGVGKSSICQALAGHWLLAGLEPALVDADPQGSAAGWHQGQGALAGLSVTVDPSEGVGRTIEDLAARHRPIIVDTAGFRNRTTIEAIAAAEVVLIPLRASPADLPGAVDTFRLVGEINETAERRGRPIVARLLLSMVTAGSVVSRHIRSQITEAGFPLLKAELANRVAWAEAALSGDTPSTINAASAAAAEIAALAEEIERITRKAKAA